MSGYSALDKRKLVSLLRERAARTRIEAIHSTLLDGIVQLLMSFLFGILHSPSLAPDGYATKKPRKNVSTLLEIKR